MTLISRLLDLSDYMPWPSQVRHLALVGNPKCGKSTIADMLVDEFGAVVIDDGLPLRRALPILTGIPEAWCHSQEGKARGFELNGVQDVVRKGLGELGNWLEARYGEEVLAVLAMKHALEEHPTAPLYVYPSVRKTQGLAYRRAGGVVMQIDNPVAGPSGNAFDVWDTRSVDLVITNDPHEMGLDELRDYVRRFPELLSALT
jgi:hypothetical protein